MAVEIAGTDRLRHEAGPDHTLTAQQEPLYREIWRLLEGMLGRQVLKEWTVPERFAIFSEPLRRRRENHVFLIEGRRGVGKTTVLLRILSDCQQGCQTLDDTKRLAEYEAKLDLKTKLSKPESEFPWEHPRRLVPLRIVDLETIPDSNPLLLQFVQHLHLLARAIWDQDLDGRRDVVSLEQRWSEFLRAAAANVPPGISSRRAALDLENFLAELEEGLICTPLVKEAFHRFMDELVVAYARWAGLRESPVFVLPIDDADMNPQRSMELLLVTRTLWHPNLVFLITGNEDLLRMALRGHCLSSIRAPLRTQHISEIELSWGASNQAVRLAEQVLDKAIPSNQRFSIPSVRVWDRLSEDEPVREKLGRLAFPVIESLKNADPKKGAVKFESSVLEYLEHDHLIRYLFKVSERTFRDFGNNVLRLRLTNDPRDRDRSIALFCEELWRTGLHHTPLLDRERRSLLDAVKYNTDVGLYVDPSRVIWEPDESYTRSFISDESPWLDCHVIRTISVRARLQKNLREEALATTELSPLATAALMLTTDVVADHETWRVVQNPSFGSRGITLVETEYQWGSRIARFPWPTPDWPAFIDHSVLVEVWKIVPATYLAELTLVQLSYCVAYLIAKVANERSIAAFKTDVRSRQEWLNLPQETEKLEAALQAELTTLMTNIGPVAERTRIDPTRNAANRRWTAALWLFTYPEYVGVDSSVTGSANNWGRILTNAQDAAGKASAVRGKKRTSKPTEGPVGEAAPVRKQGTQALRRQMAERAISREDYKPTGSDVDALLDAIASESPPPALSSLP